MKNNSFESAIEVFPASITYDPMTHKTVADLVFLVQHELDLMEEEHEHFEDYSNAEIKKMKSTYQKFVNQFKNANQDETVVEVEVEVSEEVSRLQEAVNKASEKVEKAKKTIERHKNQRAKKIADLFKQGFDIDNLEAARDTARSSNNNDLLWLIIEAEQKENDIESAQKKLVDAQDTLINWNKKLEAEIEKERFLNDEAPLAIKEFLEKWKSNVKKYCIESYPKYVAEKKSWEQWNKTAEQEYIKQNPKGKSWGSECESFVKQYLKDNKITPTYKMYQPLIQKMDTCQNESDRTAFLEKELEAEKKRKMLDLINRVIAVTGTFVDASSLKVNKNGNLDGYIKGKKGTAKVETIDAGGYNIQCYHFRTLVHEVK